MAVDTLGHLLAWHVIPANEQEHAQVAQLAEQEQDVTDASMEVTSVDQGDIGDRARQDAADHGMQLEVANRPQAKEGFLRLLRRWVVERSFGWAARFRRLTRGCGSAARRTFLSWAGVGSKDGAFSLCAVALSRVVS
jgi:transposase